MSQRARPLDLHVLKINHRNVHVLTLNYRSIHVLTVKYCNVHVLTVKYCNLLEMFCKVSLILLTAAALVVEGVSDQSNLDTEEDSRDTDQGSGGGGKQCTKSLYMHL